MELLQPVGSPSCSFGSHLCKEAVVILLKEKKRHKNVAHSFQTRAAENMRKDVRCVLGTRGNPVLHAWGAGGKAHNGFRALCPWVRGCSCSDRKNSLPQTPGSAGCAFHQHGAHIPHHRGCFVPVGSCLSPSGCTLRKHLALLWLSPAASSTQSSNHQH